MLLATPSTQLAPKGIFGKAKAEAQRAKVALTHASGHFDPRMANRVAAPSRPQTTDSTNGPFAGIHKPTPVATGPRLPAPRSAANPNKRPREASPPSPLPGARPHVSGRAALPYGVKPTPQPTNQATERFKVDPHRLESIKKPRVQNFEPPRAPTASLDLSRSSPNQSSNVFKPLRPLSTSGSLGSRPLNPTEAAAKRDSVLFVKKKPKPTTK
jgi:hypothetical protein